MEDSQEIIFVKLVASGMLLAFVLAASIVLFVLIYQKRLAQQALKMQQLKIDHQQTLIQSAIQVSEDERRQFASNLHDEIGAQLHIQRGCSCIGHRANAHYHFGEFFFAVFV